MGRFIVYAVALLFFLAGPVLLIVVPGIRGYQGEPLKMIVTPLLCFALVGLFWSQNHLKPDGRTNWPARLASALVTTLLWSPLAVVAYYVGRGLGS